MVVMVERSSLESQGFMPRARVRNQNHNHNHDVLPTGMMICWAMRVATEQRCARPDVSDSERRAYHSVATA
jgi:hypothetical protein